MALPVARRDFERDIYFPIPEDLSKGDEVVGTEGGVMPKL
jgi:hypothetical protein